MVEKKTSARTSNNPAKPDVSAIFSGAIRSKDCAQASGLNEIEAAAANAGTRQVARQVRSRRGRHAICISSTAVPCEPAYGAAIEPRPPRRSNHLTVALA